MVYFFVLPAFLLSIMAQAVLCAVTRLVSDLRPAYPFAWRVLLWSTIGFVAANAVLLACIVLPFGAYNAAGGKQEGFAFVILGAMAVFGLTVGPILASVAGFGGGVLGGVLLAGRIRSSTSGKSSGPSSET